MRLALLVTVELRSVNSRFLDLAFRLPDELRGLEPALREHHLFHATRAELLRRLGRADEADTAYADAADRTRNAVERDFLDRRRGEL